jgi:tripartite-type tricarboxylate transporter receptor subunit TctC
MYMAGIKLNHVPYKGSGPAQQDLMSGIIKVSFVGTPIAIPHMKSGRLKALGVSTVKRSPEMPDVPTIAEAGVPGYEATVWIAMLAPAGKTTEIVARLNDEIGKHIRNDEAKKLIAPTVWSPTRHAGAIRCLPQGRLRQMGQCRASIGSAWPVGPPATRRDPSRIPL